MSKGFRMELATNGAGVTEEVADRIRQAGFDRISVILDGPEAETHDRFRQSPGAFDAAVEGVGRLKKAGLSVQISTTVATHNASRLEEILSLVGRLDGDAWHLFLLVPVGCGLQMTREMQIDAKEYERILNWIEVCSASTRFEIRPTCAPHLIRVQTQRAFLHKWFGPHSGIAAGRPPLRQISRGCTAGTQMCFISHRGKVTPCGYLPLEAGDLMGETFAEIWQSAPLLKDFRDPTRLKGKCGGCEFRSLCAGCRARAYGATGDHLEEEPFCSYQPGTFSALGIDESRLMNDLIDVHLSKTWTDEAKRRIFLTPYRLRQWAVERVEAYAARRRIDTITPEVIEKAGGTV
jgi:radical SAM protein with 4Fe4S-binding SPASM domain